MLTASEREWLERREQIRKFEGCYVWDGHYDQQTELDTMHDAAEFEARVAAKLADWLARDMGCFVCGEKICKLKKDRSCCEKLLQAARLAVEEEMDADRK